TCRLDVAVHRRRLTWSELAIQRESCPPQQVANDVAIIFHIPVVPAPSRLTVETWLAPGLGVEVADRAIREQHVEALAVGVAADVVGQGPEEAPVRHTMASGNDRRRSDGLHPLVLPDVDRPLSLGV